MTYYNFSTHKQSILKGNAGTSTYNPILENLPLKLAVRFKSVAKSITAYVGTTSPPTAPITMTQSAGNTLLYEYNCTAGATPLVVGKNYFRAVFAATQGRNTIWERQFYVAELPEDAVSVYSVALRTFVNVNDETLSVRPLCCQMCGIRFFHSWTDEFRHKHFGGVKYVSIYDLGTNEDDDTNVYVKRDLDRRIEEVTYVYLMKHSVAEEEIHQFNVKFKTDTGTTKPGVVVEVTLDSVSCWGFELKDPVTD